MKRLVTISLGFILWSNTILADTHYVSLSGNHVSPFINWANAATNIQQAIDVASSNDTVLVSNGVYNTDGVAVYGTMTNRVAITNAITVKSSNGPEYTFIVGQGPLGNAAVRCAYVGANALLEGFTLTNGHTHTDGDYSRDRSGGGVWCDSSATVSNCTISGNSSDGAGGGTYSGTINNCTILGNSARNHGGGTYSGKTRNSVISGNSAGDYGGGTYSGTINNCTILGNSATYRGGGTFLGMIVNSIVYYNSAGPSGNNAYGGTYRYCCITPDPGGDGNVTNAPLFASSLTGDYRLQSVSPCINRGTNQLWMSDTTDLDGNGRIIDGVVDMGAYEFVPPPTITVLRTPHGTIITNRPEFEWHAVANASWYQLWVNKDGNPYFRTWLNGLTNYTPTQDLSFGNYQWRARAWNSTGYGPWPDWLSFSYGHAEPLSPTGTVEDTRYPIFSWTAVEGATWYYLWLNKNSLSYAKQWVNSTNSWIPSTGLPGGTYRWWARAWCADGYGPWSAAAEFVIPTNVPGMTILQSPLVYATTNRPTFAWSNVAHATWYRLWINRDRTPYLHKWLRGQTYVLPTPVPSDSYRWWVQTWSPDGHGPWSSPADFSYGLFPSFLVDLWANGLGAE